MSKITDQKFLVTQQYKDDKNLKARMELHERFSINPTDWHVWVFDHFQIPNNAEILEIGSGNGLLWAKNIIRVLPGWHMTLGDLSHGMIQEAKKLLEGFDAQFEFQTLDAQLLKYSDNQFDIVIANHMLYHVPNVERALLEVSRVLKAGGRFYAATNGNDHMNEMKELAQYLLEHNKELSSNYLHKEREYNFSIENGYELLSKHFAMIKLHLFQDALQITEARPAVDYLLSMTEEGLENVDQQKFAFYCQVVAEEIDRRGGVFSVTKSTGLFEAVKP